MTKLNNAIQFITSNEYLNEVLTNLKWCEHGSDIFDYFEYEGLEYEFANSFERKKIVKQYIQSRIKEILEEIKDESPKELFRAIYSKEKPNKEGFYGYFWSSNENTNPCVELENDNEYLLVINFDENLVDWIETLKSRIDFLYGSKEQEYYLKKQNIVLTEIVCL